MMLLVIAWGDKHGPAPHNDFEFSLKGLRNPHRVKGLRYLTGHDEEVRKNVWESPHAEERYARILRKVSDHYSDGTPMTVVFTCHAGRHRSVTFARRLAADMKAKGAEVELSTPCTHTD